MCGLAGIWRAERSGSSGSLEIDLNRMGTLLRHRGPDDSGMWVDSEAGFGLSHRRLSIVDLSPEGHQPMVSASGRFVLAYNGEIYNHRDIRKDLEISAAGIAWRGHSDTEVMLAAFEQYGFEAALEKFEGMFALSLWDRRDRVLRLAVDRLGEKPLYYAYRAGFLAFGSEIKALRQIGDLDLHIDKRAVHRYLQYGCIPAPFSIYSEAKKLCPGCVLEIGAEALKKGGASPKAYWSVSEAWEKAKARRFEGSEAEAEQELDRRLKAIVENQKTADVPVGVFLSGGIDSTAVTAAMQAVSTQKVRTFSIGFALKEYDESGHARRVAEHLGTDHTEMMVTAEEALAAIPGMPGIYDEPFADSSQIPTWLVSRLARKHVAVSLSGDGGDEVFGGYNRHVMGVDLFPRLAALPLFIRKAAASGIHHIGPDALDRMAALAGKILPRKYHVSNPGQKLHKLAENMAFRNPRDFYEGIISCWKKPGELLPGQDDENGHEPALPQNAGATYAEWMILQDMARYLPADILVKVDRAAMHNSLETRAPFLCHSLVEWAMGLPLSLKIREGRGKYLLRRWLNRYVPDAIMDRPKMGFAIPLHSWLRGPLREWAEDLLASACSPQSGFFNAVPIRVKWEEHLVGKRDWQHSIWTILMFEAWRQKMKNET